MPMELELFKALQKKPDDMTLTGFFELFAQRNNMRTGQVQALYYNGVRTDYEKWKATQDYQKKRKIEHKEPEKKISIYDKAKAEKQQKGELAEIPSPVAPKTDPSILKMRIAFLETRMKTLKDPFQLLIIEPWLEELKGGTANDRN